MRTPVVIVSGFLGSGKTTLVRNILAQGQAAGIRTAVISNEFGALGIDEALLGGAQRDFVELAGGCVCCQLSDELVQTLQRLHDEVRPERIVIETSGVALPFETQLHLYRPAVRDWIGEDACVVVVDATGGAEHAFDDPTGESTPNQTFEQQVQSADLLVLSKTDLAAPDAMRRRLAELCPGTPVLASVHGDVPIEVFFPSAPRPARAAPAPRAHTHEAYTSHELRIAPGQSPEQIEEQVRALGALRVKGFVPTTAGVRVVQGVGRRVELLPPGDLPVPDALLGRLVVIDRADGDDHHGAHDHGAHDHDGAHHGG